MWDEIQDMPGEIFDIDVAAVLEDQEVDDMMAEMEEENLFDIETEQEFWDRVKPQFIGDIVNWDN